MKISSTLLLDNLSKPRTLKFKFKTRKAPITLPIMNQQQNNGKKIKNSQRKMKIPITTTKKRGIISLKEHYTIQNLTNNSESKNPIQTTNFKFIIPSLIINKKIHSHAKP